MVTGVGKGKMPSNLEAATSIKKRNGTVDKYLFALFWLETKLTKVELEASTGLKRTILLFVSLESLDNKERLSLNPL